MNSTQRKYLRSLAHPLKPIVLIGSKGLTAAVVQSLDDALKAHELVKAKFNDNKEKAFKQETTAALENATDAHVVGVIGHTVIYYRPHPDTEKRKIHLPAG